MSKRTLGVVFFPAFDWAISPTHPEREERLLYTQDQLREEGLFDLPGITEYKPGVATYEDIERVHFCLPDVGRVCSASHLASAGGAIRAGELVLSGERERAFALRRPRRARTDGEHPSPARNRRRRLLIRHKKRGTAVIGGVQTRPGDQLGGARQPLHRSAHQYAAFRARLRRHERAPQPAYSRT